MGFRVFGQALDKVVECIKRTKTKTGLRVIVERNDKIYKTGRKYNYGYKTKMNIVFDEYSPKWNYTAKSSV